jgi:2,5-diketo-D-gluconate reductase B
MPRIGLGTWQLEPPQCEKVVREALAMGYRHVDTAQTYGNEADVGRAIAASGIGRDELFVTTKLANDHHDPRATRAALESSLERLGLSELDLYLVHWPVAEETLAATLQELAILQGEGLCRHLGVANFRPDQLELARRHAPIEVHQLEWHPYLRQSDAISTSRELRLTITAYSPLARGKVVGDPVLADIAAELGASEAQVTLRWLLDHDRVCVIPKSSSTEHLREALDAYDLELDDDMRARIAELERGERLVDPEFAPW